MSCLDVWCSFVDFIVGVVDSRSAGADVVADKYREALASLAQQVLKNLQFRFNAANLTDMDDSTFDDDVSIQQINYLKCSSNEMEHIYYAYSLN